MIDPSTWGRVDRRVTSDGEHFCRVRLFFHLMRQLHSPLACPLSTCSRATTAAMSSTASSSSAASSLLRRHPLQRLDSPSRGASALLHTLGLASFAYSFAYLVRHPNPINDSYGWHMQYLTIIGLSLSAATFAVGLLADLTLSKRLFEMKNMLSVASAPMECLISLLYWSLRTVWISEHRPYTRLLTQISHRSIPTWSSRPTSPNSHFQTTCPSTSSPPSPSSPTSSSSLLPTPSPSCPLSPSPSA